MCRTPSRHHLLSPSAGGGVARLDPGAPEADGFGRSRAGRREPRRLVNRPAVRSLVWTGSSSWRTCMIKAYWPTPKSRRRRQGSRTRADPVPARPDGGAPRRHHVRPPQFAKCTPTGPSTPGRDCCNAAEGAIRRLGRGSRSRRDPAVLMRLLLLSTRSSLPSEPPYCRFQITEQNWPSDSRSKAGRFRDQSSRRRVGARRGRCQRPPEARFQASAAGTPCELAGHAGLRRCLRSPTTKGSRRGHFSRLALPGC